MFDSLNAFALYIIIYIRIVYKIKKKYLNHLKIIFLFFFDLWDYVKMLSVTSIFKWYRRSSVYLLVFFDIYIV